MAPRRRRRAQPDHLTTLLTSPWFRRAVKVLLSSVGSALVQWLARQGRC